LLMDFDLLSMINSMNQSRVSNTGPLFSCTRANATLILPPPS
jgi:hypothetical protein